MIGLVAVAAVSVASAAVQWVSIPGGTFIMGSVPGKTTEVKAFQLAKSPVTNLQYRACVAAKACTPNRDFGPKLSGDDQPVVGVDWHQAKVFAKWVGGRLPGEAEWEFAALGAGADPPRKPDCRYGITYDSKLGFGCGRDATWPVCSKPEGSTQQGLCDMSGNVLEWTIDRHETSKDPVIRGLPWDGADSDTPPALRRESTFAEFQSDYLGFRPAR